MHRVIAIGGSFGAMRVLLKIVSALPADFPGTLLIVTHIGARRSALAEILAKDSVLPVRDARDGAPVAAGVVLLAPADYHMLVSEDGSTVRLHHGAKENHARPAIDPLFRSVAVAYGKQAIGVILTGYLDDGAAGLQAIKSLGGCAIVQDPADAAAASMPSMALASVAVDMMLRSDDIGPELVRRVQSERLESSMTTPSDDAEAASVKSWLKLENRMSAGQGGLQELAKIATPSTFTCPECHGTLWQLTDNGVPRFRCHTGHAYTARILEELQGDVVEEALWAAVRALQEREKMLRDLHAGASERERAEKAYAAQSAIASDQAALLRGMLERPEKDADQS
ncbi:chemotaxis protein CheB [Oxalobacteraceae bacterium OTU3CAMAD1]|nr:chemotaxis protein CheB [Oxalobacteraceae bacterium OTU3CAMAD1]